jgi:hypothetical protein
MEGTRLKEYMFFAHPAKPPAISMQLLGKKTKIKTKPLRFAMQVQQQLRNKKKDVDESKN